MNKETIETIGAGDNATGSMIIRAADEIETLRAPFAIYHVRCLDHNGDFVWEDTAKNKVTSQGCIDLLDKYFDVVLPVGWYIGLISATPTVVIADTLATHAGWTELVAATDYTGTRKTPTFGAASGTSPVSKASTGTIDFAMLTTVTVGGLMMASVVSGTAGVLYNAAAFSTGDKVAQNGYTLQTTMTLQLTTS